MPNQISDTKKRKSMTEHRAVLAILEMIAQQEGTTSMELMREAVRKSIRNRVKSSCGKNRLLPLVMQFAPIPPEKFSTAAQMSRFKRSQRELDKLLLDLDLATPESIESMNSIVSPKCKIRVFELEQRNAR